MYPHRRGRGEGGFLAGRASPSSLRQALRSMGKKPRPSRALGLGRDTSFVPVSPLCSPTSFDFLLTFWRIGASRHKLHFKQYFYNYFCVFFYSTLNECPGLHLVMKLTIKFPGARYKKTINIKMNTLFF